MELRHLYTLSESICEKISKEQLPEDILEDMEIRVFVPSLIFYGIDKEFYYITHNNSYNGFVHSDVVNAKINGVNFVILSEKDKEENI